MLIRVLKGYRGRLTNEQFIPPGDYYDSDPRVFGLAQYLVINGHASLIGDEGVKSKPSIDSLTLAKLREEADKRRLAFSNRATKAELIALIESAGEAEGEGDDTGEVDDDDNETA